VDPLRNRRAAAAIKLLASAVMSLSGDDDGAGSGSESESPLHDSGRQTLDDPFSLPAFNPALALMSSPKARILTITMYGGLQGWCCGCMQGVAGGAGAVLL
jgi:hypothetical protein